jgi:hypothetical protein
MLTRSSRLGLIGLVGVIVVTLAACNEVVSFSPKVAEWAKVEWNKSKTITVQAILPKAKFTLTASAYTDNAYFSKTGTTCEKGNVYETGIPGKETCTATIALNVAEEAAYKTEQGHLVVEGTVEVSGKVYEGKEKGGLKAA